ncbi:MAG: DMT family transporter [Candidatus Thermoplasmatota archaeon]|nr:DMT family transporter [Candidatus Thermoplasmatota archaeon]MBU1913863.1 DMT family transporter [Candidatus Thermoplasmatota archaeon]
MTPTRKLYIILALTILIWGNSFVVVKVAIDDGASPMLIAMARFIVASSIFGGYLIWKRPKGIDRVDMKKFLVLAFIGIGVYYFFQYYGVKFAGPSITSILVTMLCPIMIFLISSSRLGEKMNSGQKTGLLVSAAGSYLVITGGSLSFISEWVALLGGVFGVVCAVFWAIYTVEGKKIVKKYDPLVSTAYLTLLGTVMLVPLAAADAFLYQPVVFPPSFFFAALYLGVLCTVIGYVFWFRALTGLTASSTGATLFFEPVVTILFAWIILGQGIGWLAGIGGVLVMIGVIMVSRR